MPKPVPRLTEINRPFYEGATGRRLRLQYCGSCGAWIYFPRVACPRCLGDDLEWRDASGQGTVYSFALVSRHHHPSFEDGEPTVLAAVQLAEGPVMISEVVGCEPAQVHIGMPVRIVWETRSAEVAVPRFRPVGASEHE